MPLERSRNEGHATRANKKNRSRGIAWLGCMDEMDERTGRAQTIVDKHKKFTTTAV